jgi:KDO2-lipid IV(A) lauroyltransferase
MTSFAGNPSQRAERVRVARHRRRRSIRGRVASRALVVLSTVLTRLPERPLTRAAWAIGGVLYRVQPGRRRLVHDNLARVVSYLAEHDLANEATAAAARDGKALDHLTRAAFGHYVRSYLEGATLQRYKSSRELARVTPDDPAVADVAFPAGRTGPTIVVGLHFGAVEIPALWATARGVPILAPMETVADPDIQDYFERSRGGTGLKVVPLEGAAAKVRAALAKRETVALVSDRALSGSGTRIDFFGAPARLPAGPAVLALETRAPAWVVATRRAGNNYPTRIYRLDLPAIGTPKERMTGFMANQIGIFERVIADAPEQWWTLFFQIWDDIPADPTSRAAADATS